MQLSEITSPAAAFVAGLITSLHCVGMCGPLACVLCPKNKGSNPFLTTSATLSSYHAARILSYTCLGAVLGLLGMSAAWLFSGTPTHILPWAFVLFFAAIGFGLEKKFPVPAFARAVFSRAQAKMQRLRGFQLGGLLGLLTPFLPCGPLYLVAGVSIFSGSALRGGSIMGAFAAGTIPLLWLAQSQAGWLNARLAPATLVKWQRGLALLSACLLAWRAVAGAQFHPEDPSATHCPYCP